MEVAQFLEFVSNVTVGTLGWFWAFTLYKRNIELSQTNLTLVREQLERSDKRHDMLEQRFFDAMRDKKSE